jgi:hypothetical protein
LEKASEGNSLTFVAGIGQSISQILPSLDFDPTWLFVFALGYCQTRPRNHFAGLERSCLDRFAEIANQGDCSSCSDSNVTFSHDEYL